jgi:hypothetical protein
MAILIGAWCRSLSVTQKQFDGYVISIFARKNRSMKPKYQLAKRDNRIAMTIA